MLVAFLIVMSSLYIAGGIICKMQIIRKRNKSPLICLITMGIAHTICCSLSIAYYYISNISYYVIIMVGGNGKMSSFNIFYISHSNEAIFLAPNYFYILIYMYYI